MILLAAGPLDPHSPDMAALGLSEQNLSYLVQRLGRTGLVSPEGELHPRFEVIRPLLEEA